jgi:hypothetical protein
MKKSEIIKVANLIQIIEKEIADDQLKPFKYAFLRNKLKFANVIKESVEIVNHLIKQSGVTEDKELEDYINNSQEYKSFLEEDTDIEFYTIDVKVLEEEDFSLQAANALLGIIIIE